MAEMPFRQGAEAAEEAMKGLGSFSSRNPYFKLKDGEQCCVRFLSEYKFDENNPPPFGAWITVDMHGMVPTKGAPPDFKGDKWPKTMSPVCRHDVAFAGIYDECYLCDIAKQSDGKPYRPSPKVWAMACLRELVYEGQQLVGIRDMTREITKKDEKGTETTETEKAFVLVNQGHKNFFNPLSGIGAHFTTLLDRDYIVKRKGAGQNDTAYSFINLDPIELEDGNRYSLWVPEVAERYQPTLSLSDEVAERASDEFYARFFDTRVVATSGESQGGQQPAPPQQEASDGQLAAMRDRITANPGGAQPAPAQPAAPAQEQPAQPAPEQPQPTQPAPAGGGLKAM